MITLHDKETGEKIGVITEEQLQVLIDQLVEEDEDDQDYYINRPTLELFAENQVDPALLEMLTEAMGDRDELEIEWSRS